VSTYARAGALVCLWLSLVTPAAVATDYYVSPSGDDGRAGTTPDNAWKTVANVNAASFSPGDRILFEGGQTFAGNLYFDASDAGTAASPVTVSSYGSGRATINAGNGTALLAYNCGGFDVCDVNVTGSGRTTNAGDGISFYSDLPAGVKLDRVHIERVEADGFGKWGIAIGGGNGATGYRDVRVTDAIAHDNARGGVITYAAQTAANENVYIAYCQAYNNPGVPGLTTNSGHGIVMGGVNTGTVERCVAHDNGWLCGAGEGPVGIWAYASSNVTIQFNESHHNRTNGPVDGGGFDLDGGCTHCVLQYNYAHDNDGAGYLLAEYSGATAFADNVVRYNVSQNDGRKNGFAGIFVWGAGAAYKVTNTDIYNNTVFVSDSPTGTPRAVRFLGSNYQGVRLMNNVFVSEDGVRLVEVPNAAGALFAGNCYWSSGDAFQIYWGGSTYASLADWQAGTGQERIAGSDVGFQSDPLLTLPGGGGTFNYADLLAQLSAYRLQDGSPMIDAGLDLLALFGVSGTQDYYGTAVPRLGGLDVGAHEYLPDPGSARCWGANDHGQCEMPAGEVFAAIAGGGYHNVALCSDGSLRAWGWNLYGQCDAPTGSDFVAVAAGLHHSLALRGDGSVVHWGRDNRGQSDLPPGNDFVAIACGNDHCLALRGGGSLAAWGWNDYGQADAPEGDDFVAIACGGCHSLALHGDGSLEAWGQNDEGQCTVPDGSDFVAIACGGFHSLALRSDGTLEAWGRNAEGQCTAPSGTDFVAIAAGYYHSMALRSDGSLVAWGLNDEGQSTVPEGSDFAAIAAGHYHGVALVGPLATYTLTVVAAPLEGGSVEPADPVTDCPYGEPIALMATPQPGWAFAGWTGDTGSVMDSDAAATICFATGNHNVTAVFEAASSLEIAAEVTAGEEWVYQNTETTTDDRHISTATITLVSEATPGEVYDISIADDGPGSANFTLGDVTDNRSIDDTLEVEILGGRTDASTIGAGGAAYNVTLTVEGQISGKSDTAQVAVSLLRIGDIDRDGSLTGTDRQFFNQRLNNVATPYTDRTFDLDGSGGAPTGTDKQVMNQALNNVALP